MQERLERTSTSLKDAGRRLTERVTNNLTHAVDAIKAMTQEIAVTAGLTMDDGPIYPEAWEKGEEMLVKPQEVAYFAFGGDSGTGKGTIVATLARRLNTRNIMVGGDMVRKFIDVTRDVSDKPTGIDTAVDGLLTASLRNAVAKRGLLPRPLIVEGRRVPELIAEQRHKEETYIEGMNERIEAGNERRRKINEERVRDDLPLIPLLPQITGPVPYTEGVCVILTADPLMQAERYAERKAKKSKRKLPQDPKKLANLAWREWQKEQGQWPERFDPTLGDWKVTWEEDPISHEYIEREYWDPTAGKWIPTENRARGRREKDNARYVELHDLLKNHIQIYPETPITEEEIVMKNGNRNVEKAKKALTAHALQTLEHDITLATNSIPANRWPYAQTLTDRKNRPIPDMVISTTYVTANGDIENRDPQEIVDEILQKTRERGYIVHEQPKQVVLFQQDPIE